MTSKCTCQVGPGKFEGESVLTFLAYQHLGNVDESIGRYNFFKAPFLFDADASVVEAALAYGYCQACIDAHDDHTLYGLAIFEDDSGFVYCDTFATAAEYDTGLKTAVDRETDEEGDEV